MSADLLNRCHVGDCRESMRMLIEAGVRVQCVVTSPPYYGLRDYGHDGQLGLEKTPAEYVAAMVEVFRLVRELLCDDGTLWLNIGDSYAGGNTGGKWREGSARADGDVREDGHSRRNRNGNGAVSGCKPKDLIGIPWMLAFALRADGWYLRQDIIWSKPNPMPESVTDRCTKAHEYVFLLAKSGRYYYDGDAIKEPATFEGPNGRQLSPYAQGFARRTPEEEQERRARSGNKARKLGEERGRPGSHIGGSVPWEGVTRNKRSVWTVCTEPYLGAHFATYPRDLVRPCVLAGSRVGDVVFDPFLGSGTTAEVAQELGRQWVGCELNPEYVKLQAARTRQPGLVLA